MERERLQKFLARANVASRRQSETLIKQGLVTVNGQTAGLGMSINPDKDEVVYAGRLVKAQAPVLYAFHKPVGVTSTVKDKYAAKTIADFFPRDRRVYPVGRLDKNSDGLMLVTDDGELANLLMHPRYQHEKEYVVELRGAGDGNLKKFSGRHVLDGTRTQPMELKQVQPLAKNRWRVKLVLKEGKKRQIRRVARMLGYQVSKLTRVRIGKLQLGNLRPGKWKQIQRNDVI